MIPSDHFVKFYNEVFKFLERKGPEAIAEYYRTISRHQESHCLKLFTEKGLQGMYEYWSKIKIEENCDCDMWFDGPDVLKFAMHGCPSLGKVLDNDAGASAIYCNHCPGWVLPIMTKAGFYCVYDLVATDIPRCQMAIFKHRADAEKELALVRKRHPGHSELFASNL